MEELIYLSVRIACAFYLLARVYGWRKRIAGICSLLYGKTSQEKLSLIHISEPTRP